MVPNTGPWVSPCSILGPNTHAEPLRLLTRYSVAARPMVQPVLTYKRAQSLGIHAWSIALPFLHARSREDPEWDCFWGARPSHRQGLAPVLKVWLGKRGRQLPPARGERRSEGGWGEDITGMLCSPASTTPLQTHGEAQSRRNQPQNQHERFPGKGRAPALSTSHPRPPIHTLYIHVRTSESSLRTQPDTDRHTEHNLPAPGRCTLGGRRGTRGSAPAPQHRGIPTPPPTPASIPAPPCPPTRLPCPVTVRERSGPVPVAAVRGAPGRPPRAAPPRARPVCGGGGVSERKNHGKVREIIKNKVQIRGKKQKKIRSGWEKMVQRGKNAVRIGRKYGPNRGKKYISEVQMEDKNIQGPNKKSKI